MAKRVRTDGYADWKFKADGQLTVFMALTITLIFSIILAAAESARIHEVKILAQTAAELSVASILAEYNVPLYEMYGIFAVDGNREDLTGDILSYAKKNEGEGLFKFEAEQVHISELTALFDMDYKPLEKEIVQYMKFSAKEVIEKQFTNDSNTILDKVQKDKTAIGKEILEKDAAAKAEAEAFEEKETEETDGGGDRADVKDPRKSLADILKDGILSCVLPKHMSVSECRLEEKVNASENRMWCPQVTSFEDAAAVAEYLNEMNMAPKAVSKAEEGVIAVIVNEYILRHFKQAAVKTSDYACDDFKTQLQYENEYIICGHETDRDNLLDTINRVVLIRTVFNIAYLFTDAVKKAEVHTVAAALTTPLPFLEPVVYVLIMAAWGYAEGVVDARNLMDKGTVPLFKNSTNWQLSLSSLADGRLEGSTFQEGGLSYEDYLRILLTLTERNKKYERMENLIQANIRLVEGYEGFDIRRCYYGITCLFEYRAPSSFKAFSEKNGDYTINYQWSECY